MKQQNKKGRFLNMLLGTWGATLFENLLTDKGIIWAGEKIIRAGKGTIIEGHDFWCCVIL